MKRFLLFLLSLAIVFLGALPANANSGKYVYKGTSYWRYSYSVLVTVSIKITVTRKPPPCIRWEPRDIAAEPGPINSNSVLLTWSKPLCGSPSGGYQISLTELPSFDAETASRKDGSVSFSSGSIKYLAVGRDQNSIMIEGFNSSRSVKLQVVSLGTGTNSKSQEVITYTAKTSPDNVNPPFLNSLAEETPSSSSYTGTPGIRARWFHSTGRVKHYVVQYTQNLNQDLNLEEIFVPGNTNEILIQNYVPERYKVRIKAVGDDGSIAFSPYEFITARYQIKESEKRSAPSIPPVIKEGIPASVIQTNSDAGRRSITLRISNFDPATSYSFNMYNAGKVTLNTSGEIVITNLPECDKSAFLVISKKDGHSTRTTSVPYELVCQRLPTPVFGPISSNPNGFTTQIQNYDPTARYSVGVNAASNALATLTSQGLLVVTGMSQRSVGAVIGVSIFKDGFLPGYSTVSGFASDISYTPIFDGPFPTANGVIMQVRNFDSTLTWYVNLENELPGRAQIDREGRITVTPLRPNETVRLEIAASKSGYMVHRSSISLVGPAIQTPQAALTPTFSAAASSASGFTSQITNYNPNFTWSASTTAGSVSVSESGLVTVSSLVAGQSATVTIRTTRNGYNSGAGSVTGTSSPAAIQTPQAALTPTFSAAASSASGFTSQITNYNPNFTWSASTTAGSVSVSGSGLVTVSSLVAGQSATVTIRTTRNGYNSGAGSVTGTSSPAAIQTPQAALTPTFSAAASSASGFTSQITNYNPNFTWSASTTAGSVSVSGSGLVTVSSLVAGQSATVTIRTTRNGYNSGAGSVTGTSSPAAIQTPQAALTPTFSAAASSASGFTSQITNYNPNFTWSASTTAGSVSVSGSGLVTVSSLVAGQSATVTIRTTRNGYNSGAGSVTGTSSPAAIQTPQAALTPTFSAAASSASGFTSQITNYNPNFTWSASTTAGSVSVSESGLVTVSSLVAGQSATVTIRTTRNGYNSGAGSVTGTSSPAAIQTPTFGALSSAINGFWIPITNYDPSATWRAVSSTGNAQVSPNGVVGVSGIGRNTQVRVTVTVSKNGLERTANVVGSSN